MDDRLQRQSVDQRTAAEIARIKEYSARFLREQEAIREQHYCGQGPDQALRLAHADDDVCKGVLMPALGC
ncbi:hypothetical protein [Montanilutibacter psychrotolerans]|uniref:Uncharacterized protein n=1 Tax=Montanilutibacter psychrotolerans TaxID=1327343 RepID=A0A3M8STR5_9GAMM|nr:hypothetical protein [Lysobacter psychrotolerans]RNF82624.1 hypothetical protein EER27_14060 [Lysobacter psychrotolerans]